MTAYLGSAEYEHGSPQCTGILLTNLGTPDAPTAGAVRRFLDEFLSDPRVVEIPRLPWWLILHAVILRIRPPRSARLYRRIWTAQGSPLLRISLSQAEALQGALQARFRGPVRVALGMRYGKPSIADALQALRQANARRVLVLPLYPQYSASTTASTFDAVADELKTWRWVPELRMISHYHDHPGYIGALAESIREHWDSHGRAERLLFSFHGIPKRVFLAGDPYHCECLKTARLLAEHLQLPDGRWQVAFQSRFGREEWLTPYTDRTLRAWAQGGLKSVDVVCPGFSADCLETLDEIARENRHIFLSTGGESYRYIPALNERPQHIQALADLVMLHSRGWPEAEADWDASEAAAAATASRGRALALGAPR
jgi:protoporphyrin/coproporphyrin ferrochelatase